MTTSVLSDDIAQVELAGRQQGGKERHRRDSRFSPTGAV
jgi:hypothetical protein